VATLEQEAALQLDSLKTSGCERTYTDRSTGALASGLSSPALDHLRERDTLVVWRLDRLGRSLRHLVDTVGALEERGVGFRSLTEPIDTTTPGGRLVFHVFAGLGEFERDLIREHTHAGLAAARAPRRRPSVMSAEKLGVARAMYDSREHTTTQIAEVLGVSRACLVVGTLEEARVAAVSSRSESDSDRHGLEQLAYEGVDLLGHAARHYRLAHASPRDPESGVVREVGGVGDLLGASASLCQLVPAWSVGRLRDQRSGRAPQRHTCLRRACRRGLHDVIPSVRTAFCSKERPSGADSARSSARQPPNVSRARGQIADFTLEAGGKRAWPEDNESGVVPHIVELASQLADPDRDAAFAFAVGTEALLADLEARLRRHRVSSTCG